MSLASGKSAAVGRSSAEARQCFVDRYSTVRSTSERLCEPLATEDYVVQSMPDASPAKWHLAHTSWFFEQFILVPHAPGYAEFDPQFSYLFNSYYLSLGERHERPKRGLLSRPTVDQVYAYRHHVDQHLVGLLSHADDRLYATLSPLLEIGLNHEQQHQELILTDIKHLLAQNPLRPVYRAHPAELPTTNMQATTWRRYDEQLTEIGHDGQGFAYDNESPRHREFVEAFELGSRLVTCGEYVAFMEDGGYQRGELWLSEGWNIVQTRSWQAPLYWEKRDDSWSQMTLAGMRPVDPAEPVCHVSYFEADAFARWAGARLATEAEWEIASAEVPVAGNLLESETFHPRPASADADSGLQQMFGDVWEWTRSAYLAYPGYRPPEGALGEYNGKFMCNQFVLRGGSCATPSSHIRRTYRNFFPPDARWQFTGFRLARDV